MLRYVAFLRGVTPTNLKMADLRELVAADPFAPLPLPAGAP